MDISQFKIFKLENTRKIFWGFFIAVIVIILLNIIFFTGIERDSAAYYTAMAREFGEGRYKYAFYPMIPPLLSILAGFLVKIGVTPFAGVKIITGLFFLLGLLPLKGIMKRIAPENMIPWICIIYLCSPYPLRNAMLGYPEILKTFFLLLSTYLVIRYSETMQFKFIVFLAISFAMLALSRGEAILFVPFFILWLIVLPIILNYKKNNKVFFYFKKELASLLLLIFIFVLLALPQVIYVYKHTGFFFTETRTADQIVIFSKKLLNLISAQTNMLSILIPGDWHRNILETFKGFFPIFLVFIVIGLFRKIKTKNFTILDLFFISVILYNAAMFLATGGMTKRYSAVTQPFELGWVVIGAYYIYSLKFFKYWKRIVILVYVVILIILLFDISNRLIPNMTTKNQFYTVGKWIDQNRELFPSKKLIKIDNYHNDRLPVILCIRPEYAYWAQGDWARIPRQDITYQKVLRQISQQNASVVVCDKEFKEVCPEFAEQYHKNFFLVKEFKELNIQIFRRN